jgi:hypothetical protein
VDRQIDKLPRATIVDLPGEIAKTPAPRRLFAGMRVQRPHRNPSPPFADKVVQEGCSKPRGLTIAATAIAEELR